MAFGAPYGTDFDDLTAADQFQRRARSMATYLLIGAVIAIAIGLATASLNVWDQREQFGRFGDDQPLRVYILNFFSLLSTYALISAVLFAGGLLVSSLAWFQSALAEDFDDLYDAAEGKGEPVVGAPASGASDWERPEGNESDVD